MYAYRSSQQRETLDQAISQASVLENPEFTIIKSASMQRTTDSVDGRSDGVQPLTASAADRNDTPAKAKQPAYFLYFCVEH